MVVVALGSRSMGEASARDSDWVEASAFTLTLPCAVTKHFLSSAPVSSSSAWPREMSALLSFFTKATATEPTSWPLFLWAVPVEPMKDSWGPEAPPADLRKVAFTSTSPSPMVKMYRPLVSAASSSSELITKPFTVLRFFRVNFSSS